MSRKKTAPPKRQTVALEALRQGMAVIRRGNNVYTLHLDGSTKLLSASSTRHAVWRDALQALQSESSSSSDDNQSAAGTKNLNLYTDGGSRGNPGPSASGYVIFNYDESRVLEQGGEYLGLMTNNQAEYQAVIHALQAAGKFRPQELTFYVDSLLVVNQLNGQYKIKNQQMRSLYETIADLSAGFASVQFHHVRREHNRMADEEVNKILDARQEKTGG